MRELEELVETCLEADGPLTVAQFMQLALHHPDYGYYAKDDPLGAGGDFVTAPEISQIFGELLGLWCVEMWKMAGRPAPFALFEMGPGRGTLMVDVLRATQRVEGFHKAMRLCLMESNATLRARQKEVLAPYELEYIAGPEALPPMPVLALANEFFDALPIHQYIKTEQGWYERCVGREGGALAFVVGAKPVALPLPDALSFYEVCPQAIGFVRDLAQHIARYGGAALLIDYGYVDPDGADTLQATSAHRLVNPLERVGEVDLTAHVDFSALALAAEKQNCHVTEIVGQGPFLQALGIDIRAAQLKLAADVEEAALLDSAVHRLTAPDQMGALFKVMALTPQDRKEVCGFP
ncbi:MAG: SAM-dependent methyltransferase [Alphaproteobacteria bacterium]|nr:SAM-dependent methyltransferase [Alphaproteobacteria bacterium]